jgi:hypothetical protein
MWQCFCGLAVDPVLNTGVGIRAVIGIAHLTGASQKAMVSARFCL